MRTSEWVEICISIDKLEVVARVFISNGKKGEESKIAERQRESVCVYECWSKPTTALINIHNSVGERNTSVAINDCRHLWSISEEVWEPVLMRFLTVVLLLSLDFWKYDSSSKRVASLQLSLCLHHRDTGVMEVCFFAFVAKKFYISETFKL